MRFKAKAAPAYSAPAYLRPASSSRREQPFVEEVEDSDDDEHSPISSPEMGNDGGYKTSKLAFELFPLNYQLPRGYRLATLQEVLDNRQTLLRAMPRWEIANLANGHVEGKLYGGCTGKQKRKDVGHKLACYSV